MITSLVSSGRRIALVVNALTKGELTGGNRDSSTVYSLLTNREIGACSLQSPAPIHNCTGYSQFRNAFWDATNDWKVSDQFVLYFSGHGVVQRGIYCLKVGPSEQDYYPFTGFLTELSIRGIKRAIIVLDTCHSGKAVEGDGYKNDNDAVKVLEKSIVDLPDGIAIIASCRSFETSRELPDGSMSVFTHLLCQGLESGLDGTPTLNGLITVEAIINYIQKKLRQPEYHQFEQIPKYKLDNAEDAIWFALNRSGSLQPHDTGNQSSSISISGTELELLYKRTPFMDSPCVNCSIDDLDWEMIREYCNKAQAELVDSFDNLSQEQLLERLKFFSPILVYKEKKLRNSVVLCFARRPDLFFPQATVIFLVGHPGDEEIIKDDIVGPLSRQADQLIQKISQKLNLIASFEQNGKRVETLEIDAKVIREIVVNAIMHRNYQNTMCITATLTSTQLEIKSPGAFPTGTSWESFLNSPHSRPRYIQLRNFLNRMFRAEGIGRGFSLIKKYLEQNGNDSIVCNLDQKDIIRILIARKLQPTLISEETLQDVTIFYSAFVVPLSRS